MKAWAYISISNHCLSQMRNAKMQTWNTGYSDTTNNFHTDPELGKKD